MCVSFYMKIERQCVCVCLVRQQATLLRHVKLLPAIILPRLRTGHIFEACEICGCQTGGSVSSSEGCTNCWQCCWKGGTCFLLLEKGKHHEELSQAGSLPFDGKGNLNASISYFQKEATHLQAMEKRWKKSSAACDANPSPGLLHFWQKKH